MSYVVNNKNITIGEFEYGVDKVETDALNSIYFEETILRWMPKNDLRRIGLERTFIIKADNECIGFVLLCTPYCDIPYTYYMHMGIIKEYQGKGISKVAYEYILNIIDRKFIVGEIHDSNIQSQRAMREEYGEELFQLDDYHFYLLHNRVYKDFFEYDLDNMLKHYEIEDQKENIIKGVRKQVKK